MSDLVKRLRTESPSDSVELEAADRLEALEAALRQAREALVNAQSGLNLAYESASKGFIDETLLHCGHHSSKAGKTIDAINTLLKD